MRSAVRGALMVLLLAGAAGVLVELGDQLGDRPIALAWSEMLFVGALAALTALGPALTIGALLRALRARPDGRCALVGAAAGALLFAAFVTAAAPRLTLALLLEIVPVGAALGGVLGLLVGVVLAARRVAKEQPAQRPEATSAEGVSLRAPDVVLASARALAVAPLVVLLLLAVTGGPRALANLVQELAPWTLGDLHARFMIGGSVLAGCLAVSCALATRLRSRGELGPAQRLTSVLSGFVVGGIGLPVASLLLLGR